MKKIEALDFSTALLGLIKGSPLFSQFENAINKVIEGYRISKIAGISESQFLQTEMPILNNDGQWLEPILKAIISQQLLKVDYQSFGGEKKEHQLSPYILKEYRNRWYVAGHIKKAGKVLILALDRIKSVEESKEKYHSDHGFQPSEYFKYSLGITQIHDAEPQEVVLSFTPAQAQYILSQPLHHSQELVSYTTKEVRVKLKLYISQELIMAVLSYGAGVKVIKPAALKNIIKKTAGEILGFIESFLGARRSHRIARRGTAILNMTIKVIAF